MAGVKTILKFLGDIRLSSDRLATVARNRIKNSTTFLVFVILY